MDIRMILIYLSIYFGLFTTVFYFLSYKSYNKLEKLIYTDSELPKISVVIPAYNEEKSIERTIESMLESDYPKDKMEIIVVDDGSKDKTYELAKKHESDRVRIFTKENGGKGTALNLGIKKSSGEIIFTMDADTFVAKHSAKEMVRYFKNPKVMGVAPSMLVHKPKNILQRIQQGEYLFGVFIRKAFASVNAIYVAPGAFSAYRKEFFDKYGGYDTNNITEDLEIALRIQYHGYLIEYSEKSTAYTIAPQKFKDLLIQRRRWYAGLIYNTWNYRKMLGPKYGDLGAFIMPIGWASVLFSILAIFYIGYDLIIGIKKELIFLAKVNFDLSNAFSFSWGLIERSIYNFFSNPIMIFFILLIFATLLYMRYAVKKVGKASGLLFTLTCYFIFFVPLFGFWWIATALYSLTGKKVSWR